MLDRRPHEKPPAQIHSSSSASSSNRQFNQSKSATRAADAGKIQPRTSSSSATKQPIKRTINLAEYKARNPTIYSAPNQRSNPTQNATINNNRGGKRIKSEIRTTSESQFIRKRTNQNRHSSEKPIAPNKPAIKITPIAERLNLQVKFRNQAAAHQDQGSQIDSDCQNCHFLLGELKRTRPTVTCKEQAVQTDDIDCHNCRALIRQVETLATQIRVCHQMYGTDNTVATIEDSCTKCAKRTNRRNIRNRNKQRQYRQFYTAHHRDQVDPSAIDCAKSNE